MKIKIFLLLSLFAAIILVNNNARAENFAPVGAIWYYTFILSPFPPMGTSYTKFESTKDTVVNGWDCKKIELSRTYDCSGNIVNTIQYYILYSIDNKVYEIENNQQYLLYDFSKNAGEYWVMPKYDNITVYVDSVRNIVLTNGQTRRVQYVHNSSSIYPWRFTGRIIENIGFETFLFPLPDIVPCPGGGPIRCYYESGIIVHSELLPCDYSTVGINKLDVEQDGILVKNPINHQIDIQITDVSLLPIQTIAVYNNLGKLICQQYNITNTSYIIDFSNKSNGFYYVKIILNNNQTIIKKIIKQ